MSRSNNARKQTLYIKSKDRKRFAETTSSNFTIDIGENIHNVALIEVEDISMANTIYNVNSNNQNIYWIDSGSAARITQIPFGNYTFTQLLAAIKVGLDADEGGVPTYTVEIPSTAVDDKIVITASSLTFGLTTSNTVKALWDMLGYTTGVDKNGSGSYKAENIHDITYTNHINISCKTLVDNMEDGQLFSDKIHRPILAQLRRDVPFGTLMFLKPNSRNSYRAEIKNLGNSLHFQLLDDDYKEISLNGLEWTIKIVIHHATQD